MPDHTRTHDSDSARDIGMTRSAGSTDSSLGDRVFLASPPPGYELLGELGRGGIGIVYKARQARLNRTVALKMLRGADLSGTAERIRFLAEAEAVAAVRHPHVVQVFEVGEHNGLPFLALEYLAGGNLAQLLRGETRPVLGHDSRSGSSSQPSGASPEAASALTTVAPAAQVSESRADAAPHMRLEPRVAAQLLTRLAAAVQAIHNQGIVHRDLKPSNVLFDESGQPKVADFGLAKRGTSDLTKTQAVMGTPAYMSPEQAKGETKFVGPAADVWALGAILYECLTGKSPFDADDTWVVLQNVIHRDPPPPRKLAPTVPRDLELITMKCLSKEPHRRYATAAALEDDLKRFLANQPVSVRPAGPGERLVKWSRRNPAVAGLLGALVVAIVIGFAGITWALLRAEAHSRDLAKANDDLVGAFNALKSSEDALKQTIDKLKLSQQELAKTEHEASVRAEEAESREYFADISLAHQLWRANDIRGLSEVLSRCPPERRKWEWHYLNHLTRPLVEVVPTDSVPIALSYSPDGKLLAYQLFDGTLVLRDLKTRQDRHRIASKRGVGRLIRPVFRPDSRELSYVAGDEIRAVDPDTGRVFELVVPNKDPHALLINSVLALGYTPEGRLRVVRQISQGLNEKVQFAVAEVGQADSLCIVDGYSIIDGVELICASAAFSPNASRFAVMVVDTGIRTSRPAVEEKSEVAAPDKKVEPPPMPPPSPKQQVPGLVRPQLLVYDIAQGKLLGRSDGSNSRIADIAFDNVADLLAFGRSGQAVQVLPDTAEFVRSGHSGQVNGVAFDPLRRLWAGGDDGLILGHTRREGQPPIVLRGCPYPVLRIAASSKGTEIAASCGHIGGLGGAICRFDTRNVERDQWRVSTAGKRINIVTGIAPDGRFSAIDFAQEPDKNPEETARFLIVNPSDEAVSKPPAMSIRAVFLPDGRCAAIDEKGLRVYSAEGLLIRSILQSKKQVGMEFPSLVALSDSQSVVVVHTAESRRGPGESKQPFLLNVRRVNVDRDSELTGPTHAFNLDALVPVGTDVAVALPGGCALDHTGRIAAATATVLMRKQGIERIATAGLVLAWDIDTGQELFRWMLPEGQFTAAAFDPAGRLFAAGGTSAGGRVLGWDLATGAEIYSLRAHTRPVMALAFGPNGRLVTGGSDGLIKLWDFQSKWEMLTLDTLPREVGHLVFTPEGHLVAGTGFDLTQMIFLNGPPADWVPAEVRVYRIAP